MKRIVVLLLSLTLVMSLLAGCGSSKGESLKTGLAVVTSIGSSKDAGENDGLGQVDSVVVAVLVNKDGKIVDCKIDTAQTKINFSKEGKVTTDLAKVFKSKQELGTEYNMKSKSGIGKEWNEQADSLAKYVMGKTLEEVKGIAVSETGAPTGADLASSVTIKIGGYIAGIEKAVNNAKELGATTGDKLGLGVTTTIGSSKDATAEAEGVAQAYSNYAAVSINKDGKITSAAIDSSQSDVKFTAAGVITTDKEAVLQTKQEKGNDYNMKSKSGIGKEWFEQADSFAKYVVGKTASDVTGISLTETGAPSVADLASSVTIKVAPYVDVITKAANNAK